MPRKRGATTDAALKEVKPKKERSEEDSQFINTRLQKVAHHSKKYLGVHVTAAGGVEHALMNASAIGCRSMALFLRNRRRWAAAPLTDESVDKWKKLFPESGINPAFIVPHSYYFMNFASADPDLRKRSAAVLLDELRRCEKLGIQLYNIHAGSTNSLKLGEYIDIGMNLFIQQCFQMANGLHTIPVVVTSYLLPGMAISNILAFVATVVIIFESGNDISVISDELKSEYTEAGVSDFLATSSFRIINFTPSVLAIGASVYGIYAASRISIFCIVVTLNYKYT
uniref:AP_endonuc_2 domain-containing protein n=1 Tax=Panagrellus redivivus TaxID=6233 RepID=A0A7E4V9L4_PANRE